MFYSSFLCLYFPFNRSLISIFISLQNFFPFLVCCKKDVFLFSNKIKMGSVLSSTINNQATALEQSIDNKINRRMMIQREVQMSVNLAQSRDSLMWFSGLYSLYLLSLSVAILSRRNVPKVAGIPILIGGFGLLNMYDLAYGSKLSRVIKEAEYIMDNERWRLIPPNNSPLSSLYEEEDIIDPFIESRAVSTYWPTFLPFSRESKPKK